MDLGLKEKVFIVTGGAKGIGEAISRLLVEEGAKISIVGRSEKEGTALSEELNQTGKHCHNICLELGQDDNCQTIVDQTLKAFGQIDGIVNNAGVNDGVGLENGSPKAFMNSIMTNLTHYYDLVHYALPALKNTQGAIVNISSKTALTGQGGTSGYAASKGAQLALTREWAVELAPFDIRVNAIVPAEVMTPLYEKWIKTFNNPEEKLISIKNKIPLQKRMTESSEIASMAAFLLSNKSAHTTGQWLFVDGGYVHLDRSIT